MQPLEKIRKNEVIERIKWPFNGRKSEEKIREIMALL